MLARHERSLSLLLSGSYDGEVRIWDLPRKKCKAHLQAHAGWVRGRPPLPSRFAALGE